MKPSEKLVKASVYVAGILAVASALLIIFFIVLAEIGCINPRKIKLVAVTESAIKQYDGEPLVGGVELTYGELVEGHRLEIINQSKLVKVGNTENIVEFLVVDSTGADVTDLYDIELITGDLTVKKREISIKSVSESKRYDGTPLQYDKYSVYGGSLAKGDKISVLSSTTLDEVGTVENVLEYSIISKNGEDVTDQYNIKEKWGDLTINKIPITIKTDSASKYYDGIPLECKQYSITSGSLISGHSLHLDEWTTLDAVGTANNIMSFNVYDKNDVDVTKWYNITILKGKLTLEGRVITIKTGDANKEYDGTPLSNPNWILKIGTLYPGDKLVAVEYTNFDGVGAVDNVIRMAVIDQNGSDVSKKYEFDYAYGTLSVTPRKITVMTGSASKIYDGTPISCNTYNITSGSLCKGHTLSIVGRTRAQVGVSSNDIISYSIKVKLPDGTQKDVSECYQITCLPGNLIVR